MERGKKQSFENCVGLILAFLGAVSVFLFEHVSLMKVFSLMDLQQLPFPELMKIISGLAVYAGYIYTVVMAFLTIWVKKHHNFEVEEIDEEWLSQERYETPG